MASCEFCSLEESYGERHVKKEIGVKRVDNRTIDVF